MNTHVEKLLKLADAASPDQPDAGLVLKIEEALVSRSGQMGSILLAEGIRRRLRLEADEANARGDRDGYSAALDRIAAIDKQQKRENEESKLLEVELKRLRELWKPRPPAPCPTCGHQKEAR